MDTRIAAWYLRRHALAEALRIIRWGRDAPRYAQRVHVDPTQCDLTYLGWHRRHSGQVHGGDWDLRVESFEQSMKMRACRQHFEQNVPWDVTGIYEYMMLRIEENGGRYDGCSTLDEVVRRYEGVDTLFDQVRREGRLRSSAELGYRFREWAGILVHFNRRAEPVFSGRGGHRLAIARVLKFKSIPAVIGVVHAHAMTLDKTFLTRSHAC